MAQQQQTSQRKIAIYRIAKWTCFVAAWIWTTIIIAMLLQVIGSLLTSSDTKDKLDTFWITIVIKWFLNAQTTLVQEILKWTILVVGAILLIIIPLAALFLKQFLHDAQPPEGIEKLTDVQQESINKLIQVLQDDPIFTQLEALLEKQFQQLAQKQQNCIEILERLSFLLQRTPTFSDLQGLYTSSQQQHNVVQKDFSDTLHNLCNIQTITSKQVQRLGDLYEQDRQTQKTIADTLGKILPLCKQMQDDLKIHSLPAPRESESHLDEQRMTEPIPAVVPLPQTDTLCQGTSIQPTSDDGTPLSA